MMILVDSSLDSGAPTICGSLTQQKRALPHLPAPPAASLQLTHCPGRRRERPAAPGRAGVRADLLGSARALVSGQQRCLPSLPR